MASEMAMLNVRMERELRERGNAVLDELGVTPSQYVRAIWEKLASSGWHRAKAQVEEAITPKRTPEQQAEIDRKRASFARVDEAWSRLVEMASLELAAHAPLSDDKDEMAEARYEYLQEKWGELS